MNHRSIFERNATSDHAQWQNTSDVPVTEGVSLYVDSERFIRQTFEEDNRKGYELLFKRYYQPLCNHAVRFVYAKDVAEDLVIDVFSQFWQKQLQHVVTTSYRAYLFTTVRHAAFAYLKKELGREIPIDNFTDVLTEATPSTPQQELQFNELHLKIEQVVRALPPQSQKVFIMSRFEGKKNGAIAEELQISLKTVEGHITKVLSILRQTLSEYGLIMTLLSFCWQMVKQGVNELFSLI